MFHLQPLSNISPSPHLNYTDATGFDIMGVRRRGSASIEYPPLYTQLEADSLPLRC